MYSFTPVPQGHFQNGHDIRQMVFNSAIGNTDDHLKNFTILHKENGFCLSPAYDLLPDTEMRREHDLMIGSSFLPPTRADLQELADKWKIWQANKIIDEIKEDNANFQYHNVTSNTGLLLLFKLYNP